MLVRVDPFGSVPRGGWPNYFSFDGFAGEPAELAAVRAGNLVIAHYIYPGIVQLIYALYLFFAVVVEYDDISWLKPPVPAQTPNKRPGRQYRQHTVPLDLPDDNRLLRPFWFPKRFWQFHRFGPIVFGPLPVPGDVCIRWLA